MDFAHIKIASPHVTSNSLISHVSIVLQVAVFFKWLKKYAVVLKRYYTECQLFHGSKSCKCIVLMTDEKLDLLNKGTSFTAVMCCMLHTVEALNEVIMCTQRYELHVLQCFFLSGCFLYTNNFLNALSRRV